MTAPVDEAVLADSPRDVPPRSSSGGTRYRGRYRTRSSGWWRWGFPVCLALLVVSVPALVFAGMQVVLTSSDGRLIRTIDDPSAAGWQAIVEPTPIHALALVDEGGALESVSILVLTGEGAGAVIEVPASTLAPGGSDQAGQVLLSDMYAQQGIEGLRSATEQVLGVGLGEFDVVTPSSWSDLVRPVGSLQVQNPDSVGTFAAGPVELAPSRVGEYLSAQDADENELARLARHEAFWRAWLAEINEDPDRVDIVPGEVEVGLGRFVRALAVDQVRFAVLPVSPGSGGQVPIASEVAALVARDVPFPAGPEGARPKIIVLDGTGELDHGVRAAIALGAAGAQVDKVGNNTDFDVATTQIVYYDPAMLRGAELLRDVLGVGQVVLIEEPGAAASVTVVLGQDYLDVVGP